MINNLVKKPDYYFKKEHFSFQKTYAINNIFKQFYLNSS